MPVSLCEWRVRIGRFVQWMREYEIIERKEKALKERTRLLKILHERLLKTKGDLEGKEDECHTKTNDTSNGETDDQSGSKITNSDPNKPLRENSCLTQCTVKERNTPVESTTKNTYYKINSNLILLYFLLLLLLFSYFLFSLDDFLNLLENFEPLLKWSLTSFSDWIWLIGIISSVSGCIMLRFVKKNMEESQGTFLEILHKKTPVGSIVKESRILTISTVKVNKTPTPSTTISNKNSTRCDVNANKTRTEPAIKENNGYSKSTIKENITAKSSIIKENNHENTTTEPTNSENNTTSKSTMQDNTFPIQPVSKEENTPKKFTTKMNTTPKKSSIKQNNTLKKHSCIIRESNTAKKSAIIGKNTNTNTNPSNSAIDEMSTPKKSATKEDNAQKKPSIKNNNTPTNGKQSASATKYTTKKNNAPNKSSIKKNNATKKCTFKVDTTSKIPAIKDNSTPTQSTFKYNIPTQSTIKDNGTPTPSTIKDNGTPTQSTINKIGTRTQSIIKGNDTPTESTIEDTDTPAQSTIKDNGTPTQSTIKENGTPTQCTIKDDSTPTQSTINEIGTRTQSTIKSNDTPTESTIEDTDTPTQSTIKDNGTPTQSTIKDNGTPTQSTIKDNGTPTQSNIKDNCTPTQSNIKDNGTPTQSTIKDNCTPTQYTIKSNDTPTKSTIEDTGTPAQSTIKDNGTPYQSTVKDNSNYAQIIVKGNSTPTPSTIKDNTSTQSTIKDNCTPAHSTTKDNDTPTLSSTKHNDISIYGTIKDNGTPTQSAIKHKRNPTISTKKDYTTPAHATIKDSGTPSQSTVKDNNTPNQSTIKDTSTPIQATIKDYNTHRKKKNLETGAFAIEKEGEDYIKERDAIWTKQLLVQAGDVELNPGPLERSIGRLQDRELLSLAHDVSPEYYYTLCISLGFSQALSQSILAKNRLEFPASVFEILCKWRMKQIDGSDCRHDLVDILQREDLNELANKISEGTYFSRESIPTGDGKQPLTREQVDRCGEDFKRFYQTRLCRIKTDPLDFSTVLEFESIYTNLVLLRNEMGSTGKTPLDYKNLLTTEVNGKLLKRLMVEGEGGAGKTTFCSKIAWDWTNGADQFKEFDWVLVIPLREIDTDQTIGEIAMTYLSDSNSVQPCQINKYILANPSKVFIVFDGLDEFDGDLVKQGTDIAKIIRSEKYTECMVLVTTRPWKADQIKLNFTFVRAYAFIAVTGFDKEHISIYINKYFSDDPQAGQELIKLIESNDVIQENMAPFPIYIAMLCVLWRDSDSEKRELIRRLKTFSQLFKEIITFLKDHYVSKQCTDLNKDESVTQTYKKLGIYFTQIGKIALSGVMDNQLVFGKDDFTECEIAMETCCRVGVLSQENQVVRRRDRHTNLTHPLTSSVFFPHKLFQEYIAGVYLADLFESDHESYKVKIDDLFQSYIEEFRYLLYFTASQSKDVGLDITERLLKETDQYGDYTLLVDVTFEAYDKDAAKVVGHHTFADKNSLEISDDMSAHTVSGYLFIMEMKAMETLILSRRSCGPTVSRDLADIICSSTSLTRLEISRTTFHEDFFGIIEGKIKTSKLKRLSIERMNTPDEVQSRYLAKFVNNLPGLKDLTLRANNLPNCFYTELSSGTGCMAETGNSVCKLLIDHWFCNDILQHDLTVEKLFPKLEELFFAALQPVSPNIIGPLAHSSLKKLSIAKEDKYHDIYEVKEAHPSLVGDPGSLEQVFLNSFPGLKDLTFKDLVIGNNRCETILLSLKQHQHLKDIRMIHCFTEEEIDPIASAINMEKRMNVKLQHNQEQKCLKCHQMSSGLADAMCHRTSVQELILTGETRFDNAWFANMNGRTVDSKIQKLILEGLNLERNDPSVSRDLATFLCLQPCLTDLNISFHYDKDRGGVPVCLHDEFYHELARLASSSKIKKLTLEGLNLGRNDPSASRDLARFLYQQPCLTDLKISFYDRFGGVSHVRLHDEFYHENARLASSSKGEESSNCVCRLQIDDRFCNSILQHGFTLEKLFPNLEESNLATLQSLSPSMIGSLAHSSLKKLTLAKKDIDYHRKDGEVHEDVEFHPSLVGDPITLAQVFLNSFPGRTDLTFKDLVIGNNHCETILLSLKQHQHLKNISVIHCFTDEEIDPIVSAINAEKRINVKLQHDEGQKSLRCYQMSSGLADALCHRTSVQELILTEQTKFNNAWFAIKNGETVDCKIQKLTLRKLNLERNDPSASLDLARFVCQLPCLTDLKISSYDDGYGSYGCISLSDKFYHEVARLASSSKIQKLSLEELDVKGNDPSALRDLATFLCLQPCLTDLKIYYDEYGHISLSDEFYHEIARLVSSSKIQRLTLRKLNLERNDPSASRDLARFFCQHPCLTDLKIVCYVRPYGFVSPAQLHDEFYHEIARLASSSKIQKLTLEELYLERNDPRTSRDLARFLCQQPRLTDLKMSSPVTGHGHVVSVRLHDEFYHEVARLASSPKIQKLTLEGLNLEGNDPSASRDLATFLCQQPCLTDLKICPDGVYQDGRDSRLFLHDEFYHEVARLASSSKIQKLTLEGMNLESNDPSASRDLATFLCLQPCLTDLKNSYYDELGNVLPVWLHNGFYQEIARLASSSKIQKLTLEGLNLERNDPSASRDLARFLCQHPCLTDLKISYGNGKFRGVSPLRLLDEFYHEIARLASSSKIQKLTLEGLKLDRNDPSASRDLARFLCQLPCLTDLKISSYDDGYGLYGVVLLSDEFYHEIARLASSSKIQKLTLEELNLERNDPRASRDLAIFLCQHPCLIDLRISSLVARFDRVVFVRLHDEFYNEVARLASSSKIQKLTLEGINLERNDPSASRDLARFLCKQACLTDLKISPNGVFGRDSRLFLHDEFYHEIARLASFSEIQHVYIEGCNLKKNDRTASRDLARFLCLLPCLTNLMIKEDSEYRSLFLHDDFYHEIARLASSSKIQHVCIEGCNLKKNDRTASRDLARFLCLLPCLTVLTIKDIGGQYQHLSLHDDFYHEIARLASSSKIEHVCIEGCNLNKSDPTASRDLARFLCLLPCLTNLMIKDTDGTYRHLSLHDDFYHEIARLASSSKIQHVCIEGCNLNENDPTASRDLARFLCLLPCLTNLTIKEMDGEYLRLSLHDDYYHELARLSSSLKIQHVRIEGCNLNENDPSASRDLAKFLCHLPCLTNLTIKEGSEYQSLFLHDVFYHEIARLAPSSKIQHVCIEGCNLIKNDPIASRDLARFLCLLPCLTNLTIKESGGQYLHDDFYHELARLASSSKNHFFTSNLHLDKWSGELERLGYVRVAYSVTVTLPKQSVSTLGCRTQSPQHVLQPYQKMGSMTQSHQRKNESDNLTKRLVEEFDQFLQSYLASKRCDHLQNTQQQIPQNHKDGATCCSSFTTQSNSTFSLAEPRREGPTPRFKPMYELDIYDKDVPSTSGIGSKSFKYPADRSSFTSLPNVSTSLVEPRRGGPSMGFEQMHKLDDYDTNVPSTSGMGSQSLKHVAVEPRRGGPSKGFKPMYELGDYDTHVPSTSGIGSQILTHVAEPPTVPAARAHLQQKGKGGLHDNDSVREDEATSRREQERKRSRESNDEGPPRKRKNKTDRKTPSP